MAPIVYGVYQSPPTAAVLMCAKALGIEVDFRVVDLLNKEHLKDDFIQKNPQHTIPLLDDDGFLLADSHAINGYLVGTYGKGNDPLYPKDDIRRRAIIDHKLQFDSSILSVKAFNITKPLIRNHIAPTQVALRDLREAFAILDTQLELQNTNYVAGSNLSIADFSITASVTYWSVLLKNWEEEFPHLREYMDRMKIEDWVTVSEEGAQGFHAMVKTLIEKYSF